MTRLDPIWVSPEVIAVCAGCADFGDCPVPRVCANYTDADGRCVFMSEAVQ